MGGTSSSVRSDVIEAGDDDATVVSVSEAVAKRLLGREEPSDDAPLAPVPPSAPVLSVKPKSVTSNGTLPSAREDKIKMFEAYEDRIEVLEKYNYGLQEINREQFQKGVKDVESKFIMHRISEPVCVELQQSVATCYAENPTTTLNCAPQVRAFKECVEEHRKCHLANGFHSPGGAESDTYTQYHLPICLKMMTLCHLANGVGEYVDHCTKSYGEVSEFTVKTKKVVRLRGKCDMANEFSYKELVESYRTNHDEEIQYLTVLENIMNNPTWNLSAVVTVVAIGAGRAQREIELVVRLMPNLRTFIAVDPNTEFTSELELTLKNKLPGVELVVYNTTIQDWPGTDKQVDAILMCQMLYHIPRLDRQDLFRNKFTSQLLANGGYVVILNGIESQFDDLMWQFYDDATREALIGIEVRNDMVASGFKVVDERAFDYTVQLNCVVEGTEVGIKFVELFLMLCQENTTFEQLRKVFVNAAPTAGLRNRLSLFQLTK